MPFTLRRRAFLGALLVNVALPSFPALALARFGKDRIDRETIPPLPTYEPAQTAYGFGSANHLETSDQRVVKLPAGASALPAVADDWCQGFFFSIDEMLSYAGSNFVIASKGTTGQGVSGASQTGINVRGGIGSGLPAFSLELAANNPALRGFFPGFTRTEALDRGAPHLVVYGQKGASPFFALVRVGHDGRIDPAVVSLQIGGANDGANSWKFGANGTTPAYAAGGYDFLSGFGGNVDVADGGNRRSAGGAVGGFFNVWGSFPFVAGLPDAAILMRIAEGTLDARGLAQRVGGTLRYANHFRGPADLSADQSGVVTAPCVELGQNPRIVPSASAPLRQPPELRLTTYGDHFVFPMTGTEKIGAVPFEGSFEGRPARSSFEARLVRMDNGQDLVGWTSLAVSVDLSGNRFSGALQAVPAGIAFRREIRWKKRPALIVRDADRQAVGLVLIDIGQSQLAYQGYASNVPDGGGGATQAPTQGVNAWLAVVKQPFFLNAQSGGGGLLGQVALFLPYAAGQHGDGNIHTYEAIRRLIGVPVMIVDTAVPGTHPNKLSYDRKPFAYTALFTPDGTATSFTFTPVCSVLSQEMGGANIPPGVVPGSLAIRCGAIAIADDGQGNLVGAGVTGGTIAYATGRITGLTFAAPPAAGVMPTGTFKLFAVAPESSQTPQSGGWSMWGDDALPLDRSNRTGRTAAHLTRLRGVAPSMFRVFWYTAFDGAPFGTVASLFDRLKARFDAVYPVASRAPWGFALPGRSNSGTAEGTTYRPMAEAERAYARARDHGRVLGSFLDMETAGNQSPHQSPLVGSRTLGERMGVGIAAAFTKGLSVEGPLLTGARFLDAGRTAIECRFTLPNGNAIVTADGSTTGIKGFRITPTATTAWSADGFTAAIAGNDRVVLTKTSGAWTVAQKVAFGNGSPVTTGGSASEAADNASVLKMIFDDDALFGSVQKYASSGRPGNLATMVDNIVVEEAG